MFFSFGFIAVVEVIKRHLKCRPDRIIILRVTKEEKEKAGLKFNIQKIKIMASGPVTPWQIDGETVEIVTDFILECSKITAVSD